MIFFSLFIPATIIMLSGAKGYITFDVHIYIKKLFESNRVKKIAYNERERSII